MKSIVVVPTYNERENIVKLVSQILDLPFPLEVVIVDDNSPDGTGEVAEEISAQDAKVHVIHRQGKLGLGTAYIEGFRYALKGDYELIFTMDADLSHDPKYIPDFLEKIKDFDLVLSSRYLHGISVVNWDLRRLLLSTGANTYLRTVTGLKLSDLTGGFRCFKRKVLESINLDAIHSNGYAFIVETTFRAWKNGFRIGEVPIIFIDRNEGTSKLSKKDVIEAFVIPWRLKFGLYRR
jgi:dolichol-phosphate mannosyltransferase